MNPLRKLTGRRRDKDEPEAPAVQRMLVALNLTQGRGTSGHIYGGTVSSGVIAKRRARTKMAKASRRANR